MNLLPTIYVYPLLHRSYGPAGDIAKRADHRRRVGQADFIIACDKTRWRLVKEPRGMGTAQDFGPMKELPEYLERLNHAYAKFASGADNDDYEVEISATPAALVLKYAKRLKEIALSGAMTTLEKKCRMTAVLKQLKRLGKDMQAMELQPEQIKKEAGKTIREWLNELPDGFRQRALQNMDQGKADCIEPDMAEALMGFCVWSKSPEGNEFWYDVRQHYAEGFPLPVLHFLTPSPPNPEAECLGNSPADDRADRLHAINDELRFYYRKEVEKLEVERDEARQELHRHKESDKTNYESFQHECPKDVWMESSGTKHIAMRIMCKRLRDAEVALKAAGWKKYGFGWGVKVADLMELNEGYPAELKALHLKTQPQ